MASLLGQFDIMPFVYGVFILLGIVGIVSHGGIKGVLALVVIGAVAMFFYAKAENEKQAKQQAADFDAEMAWKEPIIKNCENAVRRISDADTLKLGNMFGSQSLYVDKTDSGYLYRVQASDATTANKTVTMLCYTDRSGHVVRVVPQDRY